MSSWATSVVFLLAVGVAAVHGLANPCPPAIKGFTPPIVMHKSLLSNGSVFSLQVDGTYKLGLPYYAGYCVHTSNNSIKIYPVANLGIKNPLASIGGPPIVVICNNATQYCMFNANLKAAYRLLQGGSTKAAGLYPRASAVAAVPLPCNAQSTTNTGFSLFTKKTFDVTSGKPALCKTLLTKTGVFANFGTAAAKAYLNILYNDCVNCNGGPGVGTKAADYIQAFGALVLRPISISTSGGPITF